MENEKLLDMVKQKIKLFLFDNARLCEHKRDIELWELVKSLRLEDFKKQKRPSE